MDIETEEVLKRLKSIIKTLRGKKALPKKNYTLYVIGGIRGPRQRRYMPFLMVKC